MPQHPKYYKDQKKTFWDINNNLIGKLLQYGLVHEDVIYPELETLMSMLYPVDNEEYPTLGIIWENITAEKEDQFIQDLRNALSIVLFGTQMGNYEEKIEEIKNNRDLDYYRLHKTLD
jgi:hypothetical protein